jgi:hypothetical protein
LRFEEAGQIKWLKDSLSGIRRRSRSFFDLRTQPNAVALIRAYREKHIALFLFREGMPFRRADFPEGYDETALISFIESLNDTGKVDITHEDAELLPACLTEIYVDKYFARISTDCASAELIEKIRECFSGINDW